MTRLRPLMLPTGALRLVLSGGRSGRMLLADVPAPARCGCVQAPARAGPCRRAHHPRRQSRIESRSPNPAAQAGFGRKPAFYYLYTTCTLSWSSGSFPTVTATKTERTALAAMQRYIHHDLGFYGKKGFERESTRIGDFIPAGPLPLFPQGLPFIPAGPSLYSRRAGPLFPQG